MIRSVCQTSQKGTPGLNSPAPLLLQVGVSSSATASLAFCFPGAGWATEAWWAGEGRGYYPGFCTCGSFWCQQNPQRPTAETQSPVKWWWGWCSEGLRREGPADSPGWDPRGPSSVVLFPLQLPSRSLSCPSVSTSVPFLGLPAPGLGMPGPLYYLWTLVLGSAFFRVAYKSKQCCFLSAHLK